MDDNPFFKPTSLLNEYIILDLISKNSNITQRIMSDALGVSVSSINVYLNQYEQRELLMRTHSNSKNVQYQLTKTGVDRQKVLNIGYLKSSYVIYESAKENIILFLKQLKKSGYNKLILYGAGEVAKIILQVIRYSEYSPISVVAIIDDDPSKQGLLIVKTEVIRLSDITRFEYDGILISSYSSNIQIYNKLIALNIVKSKILHFF